MKSFETEKARQIVNIIRLKGPISQTQIAQITGLSHATVSNIVRRLLKEGTLFEKCRVSTQKGRPPVLLSIEKNAAFAIGIDVGGENIRVGLVNLAGEVLDKAFNKTQPERGSEDILRRVKEMTHKIIAKSSIDEERIDGIGFGLSGIIDPKEGICLFCPNLPDWNEISVREIFSEEFETLCLVDDSVRMMALAEKRYGLGRNVNNFIYISLGIGVGCAIFIHGKLYRGYTGLAGEFGHITVEESGPLCHCGNLGCLEALVSAKKIVQKARNAVNSGIYSSFSDKIDEIYQNIDVKAITQAAQAGDKLAYEILDETGRHIGVGIAALVNLLNPNMVILGGGIAQAGEALLFPIKQTVKKCALGMISQTVSIQQSQIKKNAGIIGGATAVFDKIFT